MHTHTVQEIMDMHKHIPISPCKIAAGGQTLMDTLEAIITWLQDRLTRNITIKGK